MKMIIITDNPPDRPFPMQRATSHSERLQRHASAFACTTLLFPVVSFAQVETDAEEPYDLGVITVEATKYPEEARNIAATVTLIDEERMKREAMQNISDLVRFEPGIDVTNQGSRFGRAGFNIRGLDGNRVLIEVDGVPISNAFSIGDFSNASRDFVDVDSLKAVEIIRGPSSALFGSNAIGGVVSFVTRDPGDYLAAGNSYFDATGAWYGVDNSWQASGTAAVRAGDFSAMARLTFREGEEIQDVNADPLDYDSRNFLGKGVWGDLDAGGVKLTVEDFESDSMTDVVSLQRVQRFGPTTITTNSVLADDTRSRTRIGLEQSWNDGIGFTDYLRWRAYWQDSETLQDTVQDRVVQSFGPPEPQRIERNFQYDQEQLGLEVNAASRFVTGSAEHVLAYGLEYETSDTVQLRDGLQTNLGTGESSSTIGPDSFPLRDYPISEADSLGLYVQDSITVGAWTFIPALRYDRFEITPKPDPIFTEDNPGITPQELEDSEVTPKLGVLWDFAEPWQAFLQYSEGFRAPPVNDVNIGFTNLQFGYTAIPNPDLVSETSWGVEGGLRYKGESAQWEVTAFYSEYEDFIDSLAFLGFDPMLRLLVFQSINIDEVEISGVEARGQWSPDFFPDGLNLRWSGSWVEGDNKVNDQPLNDVAPPNGVLGLDYLSVNTDWGGSLLLRGALEQDRVDFTQSPEPLFVPDSYLVLDLTAFWRPTENTRLRGGLFNITDEEYWAWLDVAGVPASSPNIDRLRRPGFNVSVAFDVTFP